MANLIKKRKRGRPSKADAILYSADMAQLTEVENTLTILPELYEKIKQIALSDHRQQLSAAKLLLDRFEAHVDRMHKEEAAEIAAQEQAEKEQQASASGHLSVPEESPIFSRITFDYSEDESESAKH